jgi:hypothetical protein
MISSLALTRARSQNRCSSFLRSKEKFTKETTVTNGGLRQECKSGSSPNLIRNPTTRRRSPAHVLTPFAMDPCMNTSHLRQYKSAATKLLLGRHSLPKHHHPQSCYGHVYLERGLSSSPSGEDSGRSLVSAMTSRLVFLDYSLLLDLIWRGLSTKV